MKTPVSQCAPGNTIQSVLIYRRKSGTERHRNIKHPEKNTERKKTRGKKKNRASVSCGRTSHDSIYTHVFGDAKDEVGRAQKKYLKK